MSNESKRYVRKGYGIIVAMIITFSIFSLYPYISFYLLNLLYIPNSEWLKENIISRVLLYNLGSFVMFIFGNLLFVIIYHLELPFFERYKT